MRSKGKAAGDQTAMSDKQKGGKKSKFKFGKGGSNKKENGLIPGSSIKMVEDGSDVGGMTNDMREVSLTSTFKPDAYQLSNADIINGGHGTVGNDVSGQPLCTCEYPPETEKQDAAPNGTGAPSDHGNRNGPSPKGNHGNKMSVVAVIEGKGSPMSSNGNGAETTSSNSSGSSTSASICSVRPKMHSPTSGIDATVSNIVGNSPQGLLISHGNKSPSSQSLVSVASSTVAMDITGDSPFSRIGSDRPKQTLGDIIQQIDTKSKALLQTADFTTDVAYPDLQFLAHQSRYSSDIHIKRRLIAKLVDSQVVDIFLRVFHSVHTVDYLGESDEARGMARPRSKSASEPSPEERQEIRSLNSAIESASTCALAAPPGDEEDESPGPLPLSESSQHSYQQRNAESKSLVSTEDLHGANIGAGGYPKHGANNGYVPPPLKNLRAAITLMWNTTDKSPILCEECIKKGLIQTLLEDLRDPRLAASELKDQQRLYLVKGYLGILNNIVCFFNDARELFREAGAIKILQPYLKSSLLLVKTKTIMLLSYIINESENDVINASDKNIGFTVKMLEATLEKDNHYSKKFGFWAVEVAAGLNRLGNFEANKERIVEKGVLPLYLKLIVRPYSEDEQLIATQGLWTFAFSENARNTIKEDTKVLDALHVLHRTASREEIKRVVSGGLWIIEGRGSGVGAVPKSPRLPAGAGHIYVSYHWSCRHLVIRLRDRMRSFGYKVFVDTENMGTYGLPLETLFEAMEKTCVVLVCMTQKYKDSPSCRNELEHAHKLRRDVIPLRLQQRYNPDGWLANIVSSRLVFDFSREENLDNVTASLVRELGPRGRSKSALAAAAAAASVGYGEQRHASRSPSNQSVTSVTTACSQGASAAGDIVASKAGYWSEEEVTHWLMENGLTSAIDKFQAINGELLCEMRKMHQIAPESFYTMLRNELNFDWITQLRFTRALDHL